MNEEREKIKKNPYKYIKDEWAEGSLPHVGEKTFKFATLMPCSQIIPDISIGSKVIKASINLFEVAGSGTGKCLKKGTKVYLSNGLIKYIENIEIGDEVLSLDESTFKINKSKVISKLENGKRKILKIKTKLGSEIFCTSNHPFYTISGWKEAKELSNKESIAIPFKYSLDSNNNVQDYLIKILAYLIADGYYIKPAINFSKKNPELIRDFEESIKLISNNLKVVKYEKKEKDGSKKGNMNCQVSAIKVKCTGGGKTNPIPIHNDLVLILEKLGMLGENSYTKHIPEVIMRLEGTKMGLFLNRLFACDGCISKRKDGSDLNISYSSNSKILIYQIKQILSRNGILSKIRFMFKKLNGKLYPHYELTIINKECMKRFIRFTGLLIGKEQRSFEILKLGGQKQYYSQTIPSEIWKEITKEIESKKLKWGDVSKKSEQRFRGKVSIDAIRKIDLDIAKKYANSDIVFDKIISINEEEEAEVYDLIIKDYHNFIAEGIIVHNSSKADKFEKIAYEPLKRRDMSVAELQTKAIQMELMSLIIEDFSVFSQDYEKIKVLEGISGEESAVDKSNMRTELVGNVRVNLMLFGTPNDLERYAKQLEGGLLSRCVLNVIYLSPKEHNEIGKFINLYAGDKEFSDKARLKEEVVIEYYKDLRKIQAGENESIHPIAGYHIEKRFKEEIYEVWSRLSDRLIKDLGEKSYIRDLNYYYKFLVSSAFLNVYHRKLEIIDLGRNDDGKIIKGSIITPNEEDHKLATELMKQNMRSKWALDKAMFYKRNSKTFEMFKHFLQNEKGNDVKNILMNISPYARLLKNTTN